MQCNVRRRELWELEYVIVRRAYADTGNKYGVYKLGKGVHRRHGYKNLHGKLLRRKLR
jgi:hypothetical protein